MISTRCICVLLLTLFVVGRGDEMCNATSATGMRQPAHSYLQADRKLSDTLSKSKMMDGANLHPQQLQDSQPTSCQKQCSLLALAPAHTARGNRCCAKYQWNQNGVCQAKSGWALQSKNNCESSGGVWNPAPKETVENRCCAAWEWKNNGVCKEKTAWCLNSANNCKSCDGVWNPEPAAAGTTTQAPKVCSLPQAPFGTCAAWGDPHYTATFHKGKSKFDYMGLGVHRLAAASDGCFEVQAFQCPYYNKGAAIYAAFAIKDGPHIVELFRDIVYVDGMVVSSSAYPSNLTMIGELEQGFCMSSTTCESVGRVNVKKKNTGTKSPGFYLNMAIRMASESISASSGTCVKSPPKDSKVPCADSLFSSEVMDQLLDLCGMPDCQTPAGYKPANGHVEMCSQAGIELSQAESACSSVLEELRDGCMFEYCASDGDDTAVENVPSTTGPAAEEIDLPTTEPPSTPPPFATTPTTTTESPSTTTESTSTTTESPSTTTESPSSTTGSPSTTMVSTTTSSSPPDLPSSLSPTSSPTASSDEDEGPHAGCEAICKDSPCDCLAPWSVRCGLKSCHMCPECANVNTTSP